MLMNIRVSQSLKLWRSLQTNQEKVPFPQFTYLVSFHSWMPMRLWLHDLIPDAEQLRQDPLTCCLTRHQTTRKHIKRSLWRHLLVSDSSVKLLDPYFFWSFLTGAFILLFQFWHVSDSQLIPGDFMLLFCVYFNCCFFNTQMSVCPQHLSPPLWGGKLCCCCCGRPALGWDILSKKVWSLLPKHRQTGSKCSVMLWAQYESSHVLYLPMKDVAFI